MSELYHIYCDESRHLERDDQPIMLLGAVTCPVSKVRTTARRLRELKQDHGISPFAELKWTRVSPSKVGLYVDVVDYFFDTEDLEFRAVVVDKSVLDHDRFEQDHDMFYYKMYFQLLKVLLSPGANYRVFLDLKDTLGGQKVKRLHEVLANSMYDFRRQIVQSIQIVRSHEVEQIQLCDILLGGVGYGNLPAEMRQSDAKEAVVSRIQDRSGYSLRRSTLLRERKLNLLHWRPAEAR